MPSCREAATLCIVLGVLTAPLGCGDPAATTRAPAPRAPAVSRPLPGRQIESPSGASPNAWFPRDAAPPSEPIATLALIVDEPDSLTRRVALEALARDWGALDGIAAAMVDPDESIRERAQELFDAALERQ